MIGIVDLDMGNLRSVANAVSANGFDSRWVKTREDFDDVTHLILPGVGSFTVAMQHMAAQGLVEPIRAHAAANKPLLGICLGMQLLATTGDEGGPTPGLDVVGGHVVRFDPSRVDKIPHVGWNELRLARPHPVMKAVKSGVDFYYVHSFHFVTARAEDRLGVFEYCGGDYTGMVARDNVIGVQFHPEKSQSNGLRLLEEFCSWDGRC